MEKAAVQVEVSIAGPAAKSPKDSKAEMCEPSRGCRSLRELDKTGIESQSGIEGQVFKG